ncbi:MAG: hypothetical protein GY925_12870 [Actinomycetia bacterium]|nr:hypothetical protein [Actinomycetes bacterium]
MSETISVVLPDALHDALLAKERADRLEHLTGDSTGSTPSKSTIVRDALRAHLK